MPETQFPVTVFRDLRTGRTKVRNPGTAEGPPGRNLRCSRVMTSLPRRPTRLPTAALAKAGPTCPARRWSADTKFRSGKRPAVKRPCRRHQSLSGSPRYSAARSHLRPAPKSRTSFIFSFAIIAGTRTAFPRNEPSFPKPDPEGIAEIIGGWAVFRNRPTCPTGQTGQTKSAEKRPFCLKKRTAVISSFPAAIS